MSWSWRADDGRRIGRRTTGGGQYAAQGEVARLKPGSDVTAAHVGVELWHLAQHWCCRVNAELEPLGLTLAHWRVLDGTRRLIAGSGDAVSQTAVALHTQMDRMAMSRAMSTLAQRGLVDRGPDLISAAYRIWLTPRGERAREQAGVLVEAASRAVLGRSYAELARALGL